MRSMKKKSQRRKSRSNKKTKQRRKSRSNKKTKQRRQSRSNKKTKQRRKKRNNLKGGSHPEASKLRTSLGVLKRTLRQQVDNSILKETIKNKEERINYLDKLKPWCYGEELLNNKRLLKLCDNIPGDPECKTPGYWDVNSCKGYYSQSKHDNTPPCEIDMDYARQVGDACATGNHDQDPRCKAGPLKTQWETCLRNSA